ncbi:MAG: carbamoyl-phosphate synthase large subunit, partial [Oscillospiraceae bacterium]|nr:carbamoyl-phosphate synthase large subunit [Oscillospiraceae bacterium]
FDPVGIHTGDSIVIAPAVTLSDREYQMLRTAAINIISELKVEGGCNCQFALHPTSMQYAVIEVNPRVSRSSALASKATGYPIAKVAAKIAVGFTLDEILNAVTGKTYACFEPAIDYVVVKFPKWPFDKFVYAKRTLGTQMKATGEVMAIGTSFEQAMMKAVRSIELGLDSMNLKKLKDLSDEDIRRKLHEPDDERSFVVFEALKRGVSVGEIHGITMIDNWFLSKLKNLAELEEWLADGELTEEKYDIAKRYGYLDSTIERMSGQKCPKRTRAVYKMVDTCAGEFKAETPYFYSTFDEENEAKEFIEHQNSGKKKVIVFGSGPIRIGQGIEFDYCSVHCVWTLKEMGCEAVICNNNPETVSTDFDTGDRLYFDPLTKEDVESIIETEQPYGVVVQFGGQTAIKLTRHLSDMGVRILGTSADSIDAAEDRERFDELLNKCGIPRPAGHAVMDADEAISAARSLGYPVLMRPSYVLGGQNMIIAHSDADIYEYMEIITGMAAQNPVLPVLIDKYMMGKEVEVDAICDGTDYLIPGIMEHIERAGIHSGDSISVYPALTLTKKIRETIIEYTRRLAMELDVIGLVNIQYVVYNNEVYVIEVNPRSSRTVPYISKVTGIPMVDIATKIMLGVSLKEQGYSSGLYKEAEYIAVKVPVFSFEKLHDVDTALGPEMKSTGECLGIAHTFEDALFKGLIAAGYRMKKKGGVLFTVRDTDKQEIIYVAEKFERLGFDIYATSGTASVLNRNMIATSVVRKASEDVPNVMTLLDEGKIDYVVSTSAKGRIPQFDSVKIRRKSVERSICCLTAIDTANAVADILAMGKNIEDMEMIDITGI